MRYNRNVNLPQVNVSRVNTAKVSSLRSDVYRTSTNQTESSKPFSFIDFDWLISKETNDASERIVLLLLVDLNLLS